MKQMGNQDKVSEETWKPSNEKGFHIFGQVDDTFMEEM